MLLLLSVVIALPAAGASADPPSLEALVAPGVSIELAQHRAATIGDVAYDVDLTIPRDRSEPLRGTVAIAFMWHDSAELPVVIDFQAPGQRLTSIRVNGELVAPDLRNNHIVVPAGLLAQGVRNVVEMAVEAGDGPLNRQDEFLYTLLVPDRAHHALPVFDQPNLKASFTLTLDLPEGWTAVSNGRKVSGEPLAGGRSVVRFAPTAPISSYLFAFAAGEWQRVERSVGGHPMALYHRETDQQRVADNLDALFELHAEALAWLEDYTGIPYPFDLFEFVAVPSFQYNGMEHPGAVYYRASSLFLEPSATQAQMLGRASVIAHETAHMWFGDLVTMRWFDDVWTKEVFANFFAAKIVGPAFPELDHDLRFVLAHHPAAYRIDRSRGANPIRQDLANLAEAGALYGPIIYQKAPIVMRQLERLLGEEAFRDGMRAYLERFAFGNATWPELIAILDERTDEDLARWSDVWVEQPGRPEVVVSGNGDGVMLAQRDPQGLGRVWTQTIEPAAYVDGRVIGLGEVRLGEKPVRLNIPGTRAPDWVLPDAGGYGYGRFVLDGSSLQRLLASLPALEKPVHRAVALLTLYDAVLHAQLPPADFHDVLVGRISDEAEEQLLTASLNMLETTFWLLLSEAERDERAATVEAALLAALEAEGPPTRKAALFGALRRVALTDEALAVLREVWAAAESPFPDLHVGESDRTATALELALREVGGWEQILDEELARIDNPERSERLRFLRDAVDADPAVREAFFERLRDRGHRSREPWVQTGLTYLNHPLRAQQGLRFLRPSLELLEEIQRTGDIFFPQNWMQGALSGHASAEAVEIVEDFLRERPDYPPRLREKILQALDMTERAAAVRAE